MEVGVGQSGNDDLVWIQLDPKGVRVCARLELDRGAGKGHSSVRDADGLDPAEALLAGEGRDPAAGDQRVERHQWPAQKRSGSWIGAGSARSSARPVRS